MATLEETLDTMETDTANMVSRANDIRPVLIELARRMELQSKENFQNRTDPFSGRWPDVTEGTLAIRGRTGRHPSGALMGSIKATVDTNNRISLTANTDYATGQAHGIPHNKLFGLEDVIKPVPARPWSVLKDGQLTPELSEWFENAVLDYILFGDFSNA